MVRWEQILSKTDSSSCWVYPRVTRSESSESRHLGGKTEGEGRRGGGKERGRRKEERREDGRKLKKGEKEWKEREGKKREEENKKRGKEEGRRMEREGRWWYSKQRAVNCWSTMCVILAEQVKQVWGEEVRVSDGAGVT